jgi:hypothetical protein
MKIEVRDLVVRYGRRTAIDIEIGGPPTRMQTLPEAS